MLDSGGMVLQDDLTLIFLASFAVTSLQVLWWCLYTSDSGKMIKWVHLSFLKLGMIKSPKIETASGTAYYIVLRTQNILYSVSSLLEKNMLFDYFESRRMKGNEPPTYLSQYNHATPKKVLPTA